MDTWKSIQHPTSSIHPIETVFNGPSRFVNQSVAFFTHHPSKGQPFFFISSSSNLNTLYPRSSVDIHMYIRPIRKTPNEAPNFWHYPRSYMHASNIIFIMYIFSQYFYTWVQLFRPGLTDFFFFYYTLDTMLLILIYMTRMTVEQPKGCGSYSVFSITIKLFSDAWEIRNSYMLFFMLNLFYYFFFIQDSKDYFLCVIYFRYQRVDQI